MGSPQEDRGWDVTFLPDGAVAVCGWTEGAGWEESGEAQGGTDAIVLIYEINGDLRLAKRFGGPGNDNSTAVAGLPDGRIVVAGNTDQGGAWITKGPTYLGGEFDGFLVLLSAEGNVLWSVLAGGAGWDGVTSIELVPSTATTPDIMLSGFSFSPSSGWLNGGYDTTIDGFSDAFLARYDQDGALLWGTFYGGSGGSESIVAFAQDSAGGFFICGGSQSGDLPSALNLPVPDSGDDAFVARLDLNGTPIWSRYVSGAGKDVLRGLSLVGDSSVIVSGESTSDELDFTPILASCQDDGENGVVLKLDSAGNVLWGEYGGSVGVDLFTDGNALAPGGLVYLVGSTESQEWVDGGWDLTRSSNDGLFTAISVETGEHVFSSYVGGANWDYAHALAVGPSGEFAITGLTLSGDWVPGDALGGDGFVEFHAAIERPSRPSILPILSAQISEVSVGNGAINYIYEWESDGGDPEVVQGPTNSLNVSLQDGDNGVSFDSGETWTLTVTPVDSNGLRGDSIKGTYIFDGQMVVHFSGWMFQ